MPTTIEQLELEVQSSSTSAVAGIDALSASLSKVKNAIKGGIGLTSVANQVRNLDSALKSMDSSGANKIDKLASSLDKLRGLGSLKISSSIGNQLRNIGSAAASLTGVDFSAMEKLGTALQPLNNLNASGLKSTINALNKLPKLADTLDNMDMTKFTSQIQQLSTALAPLTNQLNAVTAAFNRLPTNIQRAITVTNRISQENNKAANSYMNLYAKIKMAMGVVRTGARLIASWITQSNQYIEDLNLFTASMGKYAEEAQNYAEAVSDALGIDPGEFMRNQGVFNTIISGFGVASDKAYLMSKNLTQLGYDISSFFNISFEDAMQKLQSGISGELEPLRRLGYDLSVARLQEEALALGIKKKVSAMTQAEKSQLRYYAIMTQVTTAQGDMARTLNAPANQLRILKAQVMQCARALGNIFIPMLNAVIPYAIALVKIVRMLADSIASLFGFTLPEIDYSGVSAGATAVGDLANNAGDASDGLSKAGKAAKKLKNSLLGIDELNILSKDDSSSGSGSGSGSGAAIGGGNLGIDLPTYDFLGNAITSKVDAIIDKLKEWLGLNEKINSLSDLLHTRLGRILTTVSAIALGLATWKISKGMLSALKYMQNLKKLGLDNAFTITVGISLLVTGVALERAGIIDAVKYELNKMDFAQIIAGGLLTTGGSSILGKGIAGWIMSSFADSSIASALTTAASNLGLGTATAAGAAIGAGIGGIIAGIPAYFTGIYDALKNGLNWLNGLLIPAGSTAAAAGIGAIIGACGGPIGAGIGALIGLAVGLVTDGIIAITEHWEEVTAWFDSTCATIGQFFSDLWQSVVDVWDVCADWFNENVIQPVAGFFTDLWNGISSTVSTCWDSIVEFFSPAIDWFSELFGSIFQTISDIFYNIGVIASGCWEIIKAVWGIVSEWFSEHIITPITTFFSNMWNGIKDGAITVWNGIESVFSVVGNWFNENVIQPVAGFFTDLWDGFVNGARKAWDGVKSVFSPVAAFFSNTFKKAWQGIVKVFSTAGEIFVDIKDGIVSAFKTVVNGIIKGLNKVVSIPFNGINAALKKIRDAEIAGWQPFSSLRTITVPQIPLLAEGGIITPKNVSKYAGGTNRAHGSMFVAGESGAELVGHVNGNTEVLNRFQMGQIMHSSIIAGMAQFLPVWKTLNNTLVTSANAIIQSVLVSAEAVNSHLATQVTYDPSNILSQSVYDETERIYGNSCDESAMASVLREITTDANNEQNALLREQNNLLRRLLDKDQTVRAVITAGDVVDGLNRKNRRDGKITVPVG